MNNDKHAIMALRMLRHWSRGRMLQHDEAPSPVEAPSRSGPEESDKEPMLAENEADHNTVNQDDDDSGVYEPSQKPKPVDFTSLRFGPQAHHEPPMHEKGVPHAPNTLQHEAPGVTDPTRKKRRGF